MCVCPVAQSWPTPLGSHGLNPTRLLCLWDFPGKEYWSELRFPSPGNLPDPEMEPVSPAFPALAGTFFTTDPSRKSLTTLIST